MKSPEVSILDYEMGNIKSIINAFESIGAITKIINKPEEILEAERLVIPGVGAFKEGMFKLKEKNLIKAIKRYTLSGKPLLGICLGMQFLMDESEEFGVSKGLGIIPGKVISLKSLNEKKCKIPHMGWDKIINKNRTLWSKSVLKDVDSDDEFYFVHSFVPKPNKKENILSITKYGNKNICSSIVKNDVIIGLQFHPEKSGNQGLKILRNFVKL